MRASCQHNAYAIAGVHSKFVFCVSKQRSSPLTMTEQVAKIIPYGHSFWLLTRQRHMHKRCATYLIQQQRMKDIANLDSVRLILESNVSIISEFRTKYHFQGDIDYLHLFDALLIFYDQELFDKLDIKLSELNRLKNAYFWYSEYIVALKKQNFPVSDHEQAKFKIIEEIDRLGENIDWAFIKEIDELT